MARTIVIAVVARHASEPRMENVAIPRAMGNPTNTTRIGISKSRKYPKKAIFSASLLVIGSWSVSDAISQET